MFSDKVTEFFYIWCNVIEDIHLQLSGESVDDARESNLSSLKEKKHCSSFVKYNISSGLSSTLTTKNPEQIVKASRGREKLDITYSVVSKLSIQRGCILLPPNSSFLGFHNPCCTENFKTIAGTGNCQSQKSPK